MSSSLREIAVQAIATITLSSVIGAVLYVAADYATLGVAV